ncbi:MAG TPA: hypothetical protein VJ890_07075 [Vineibacter sp.]|nr:hypothetical protein [Vineibacter sp.]
MNRFARGAALTAILTLPLPAGAEALPGTSFTSGEWKGAAYERNGRFSHCAIDAVYRSGIKVMFSVSADYTWRIAFAHGEWNFAKNQSAPITLWIDGFAPHQVTGIAVRHDLVLAELPDRAALFEQFQRGYRLTVVALGRQYAFNLTGTFAALDRVAECVMTQRQIAGLGRTAPPAGPAAAPAPAPASAARASVEQRLEATKLVANIMARSDMSSFRILTDKDIKAIGSRYLSESDVVWQAQGVLGILRIVPKGVAKGLRETASQMLAAEAKACKGSFVSGFTDDTLTESAKRMLIACETPTASLVARYTIIDAPDGSHYVFITTGRQGEQTDRATIEKAEMALRNAVFEVMGR